MQASYGPAALVLPLLSPLSHILVTAARSPVSVTLPPTHFIIHATRTFDTTQVAEEVTAG